MEFQALVPEQIATVLLPTGTLEAHGAANNGADNTAPLAIARQIAARVNGLVAPVVNSGMTIGESAYRAFMTDTFEGFARRAVRRS